MGFFRPKKIHRTEKTQTEVYQLSFPLNETSTDLGFVPLGDTKIYKNSKLKEETQIKNYLKAFGKYIDWEKNVVKKDENPPVPLETIYKMAGEIFGKKPIFEPENLMNTYDSIIINKGKETLSITQYPQPVIPTAAPVTPTYKPRPVNHTPKLPVPKRKIKTPPQYQQQVEATPTMPVEVTLTPEEATQESDMSFLGGSTKGTPEPQHQQQVGTEAMPEPQYQPPQEAAPTMPKEVTPDSDMSFLKGSTEAISTLPVLPASYETPLIQQTETTPPVESVPEIEIEQNIPDLDMLFLEVSTEATSTLPVLPTSYETPPVQQVQPTYETETTQPVLPAHETETTPPVESTSEIGTESVEYLKTTIERNEAALKEEIEYGISPEELNEIKNILGEENLKRIIGEENLKEIFKKSRERYFAFVNGYDKNLEEEKEKVASFKVEKQEAPFSFNYKDDYTEFLNLPEVKKMIKHGYLSVPEEKGNNFTLNYFIETKGIKQLKGIYESFVVKKQKNRVEKNLDEKIFVKIEKFDGAENYGITAKENYGITAKETGVFYISTGSGLLFTNHPEDIKDIKSVRKIKPEDIPENHGIPNEYIALCGFIKYYIEAKALDTKTRVTIYEKDEFGPRKGKKKEIGTRDINRRIVNGEEVIEELKDPSTDINKIFRGLTKNTEWVFSLGGDGIELYINPTITDIYKEELKGALHSEDVDNLVKFLTETNLLDIKYKIIDYLKNPLVLRNFEVLAEKNKDSEAFDLLIYYRGILTNLANITPGFLANIKPSLFNSDSIELAVLGGVEPLNEDGVKPDFPTLNNKTKIIKELFQNQSNYGVDDLARKIGLESAFEVYSKSWKDEIVSKRVYDFMLNDDFADAEEYLKKTKELASKELGKTKIPMKKSFFESKKNYEEREKEREQMEYKLDNKIKTCKSILCVYNTLKGISNSHIPRTEESIEIVDDLFILSHRKDFNNFSKYIKDGIKKLKKKKIERMIEECRGPDDEKLKLWSIKPDGNQVTLTAYSKDNKYEVPIETDIFPLLKMLNEKTGILEEG